MNNTFSRGLCYEALLNDIDNNDADKKQQQLHSKASTITFKSIIISVGCSVFRDYFLAVQSPSHFFAAASGSVRGEATPPDVRICFRKPDPPSFNYLNGSLMTFNRFGLDCLRPGGTHASQEHTGRLLACTARRESTEGTGSYFAGISLPSPPCRPAPCWVRSFRLALQCSAPRPANSR